MTHLAILSDVHVDLDALSDALLQIDKLACDAIVCAGDLIDYGAFPNETIALLASRQIPCIRGNHDRWRLEGQSAADSDTHNELTEDSLRFLAGLPLSWDALFRRRTRRGPSRSDMEGIYPAHASHGDLWSWLDETQADVLLVRHTHMAFALTALGGSLVANPGALLRAGAGQPENVGWVYDLQRGSFALAPTSSNGTFGVLELPAREFKCIAQRMAWKRTFCGSASGFMILEHGEVVG